MGQLNSGSIQEERETSDMFRAERTKPTIQREHYPLPTIEDVATRLHGAKVFTKLDVRNGFWHVKLDEESSLLLEENAIQYSICAGNISTHELIKGMRQIEVVADDFVVVGYGGTLQEASQEHDKNSYESRIMNYTPPLGFLLGPTDPAEVIICSQA